MKPKTLITGGAGFIGSHLVDHLMEKNWNITILDNLSTGKLKNIQRWLDEKNFTFIEGDLKNPRTIQEALKNIELIYHFAANPEVHIEKTPAETHFQENLTTTFNLLEAMKQHETARTLIFASTSTVYGDAKTLPTPENYGPTIPISIYGATKLGCEALATSYAHTFNLRTLILRLANIIGPRTQHGVIPDFIKKLKTNPKKLEILGDGTQKKSYLHIQDCINAISHITKRFLQSHEKVDIYNIGSTDQTTVKEIAKIITEEMKLKNVRFTFTGGVDGGRGWPGDVKIMLLSIQKLLRTGWKPKYSSREAVRLTTIALLKEIIKPKPKF